MNTRNDLGLLTADEFVSRRSVTLQNNPEAKLTERFEVDHYFSKQKPDHLDEIIELAQAKTQPLGEDVRMLVTLVAYGECKKIRKTLDTYLQQDLPRSQFEIIILDNHPESVMRDCTFEEVQSFKEANPSISVVYVYKIWRKGEFATVGNARKYVFDIALERINKRNKWDRDSLLISNDADTVSFDDNYLSSMLEAFESNTIIDALVTLSVVPKSVIIKPNIYAALTLWDGIDESVARDEPYNLIGRSSAYRTSIYCGIGGYNPAGKLAGDLETGRLIADARDWNPLSVVQFKQTRHIQDPRRILMAVASRVPINEMYFDFVSKPEIRLADNDTLLGLIPDQLDWELFEEDADSFWQGRSTGMYKWRGNRFASDFKEAMDAVGAEYEIVDDRVKIKSVDRLLSNFKNEFGTEVQVIHSKSRDWNPGRQNEMKVFFSSVSDGMIGGRAKMAAKILEQIKTAEQHKETDKVHTLKAQLARFSV